MMRFAALASVLCLAMPAAIRAEEVDQPVVVELFTSQGCASCPPADALMHKLVEREDVLALAFHVDYWDYIGWKDVFADPTYTQRQKDYARAMGRNMVHTPQMIVMGQEDVHAADPLKVGDAIKRHQTGAQPVALDLTATAAGVEISVQARGALPKGAMRVDVVRFTPLRRVSISRGELAGRTMAYANIVEDWQQIAEWDGQEDLNLTVPLPGDQSLAVLVQEAGSGPIIAAAQLK